MSRVLWLFMLLLVGPHALAAPAGQRPPSAPSPPSYDAIGAGHYIRAVSEGGRYLTLEDRSRWEIDPRVWFRTATWQPDEGISVGRATPENGFTYQLNNTDTDDGALARYLGR